LAAPLTLTLMFNSHLVTVVTRGVKSPYRPTFAGFYCQRPFSGRCWRTDIPCACITWGERGVRPSFHGVVYALPQGKKRNSSPFPFYHFTTQKTDTLSQSSFLTHVLRGIISKSSRRQSLSAIQNENIVKLTGLYC
jgi:hypothetical protein